jgi:heterodisulfide reductase subunit C
MSVLERLKAMVKEAQEDIDKSRAEEEAKHQGQYSNADGDTYAQTSSEDKVKKIQKYRKSASNDTTLKNETVEEPETEVITPIHAEKDQVEKTPEPEAETKEEAPEEEDAHVVEVFETPKKEEVEEKSVIVEIPDEGEEPTKTIDEVISEEEELDKKVIQNNELSKEESKEEESSEEETKKTKKSDKMTLLDDNEVYGMDALDEEFHQKFIDAGVESVDLCFQCGTCGGTCPSGRRTPYRVRKLVRNCLLGLKEAVITDDALWMCTTCYTCQERCPRGVKIVDVVKQARREASHAGYMAKAHKMTGVFVMNSGHGVPINDATKEMRKRIGLPEIPPTTHAHPEALAEVQNICKACGFDELIGYDEATGGLKE